MIVGRKDMIKKLTAVITVIMMLISVTALAADTYGGYAVPVDIDINGSFIKCAEKPILAGGTTYIPLRAFSDAIGGAIGWSGEEMAATMTKDGHTFVFYIQKDCCLVDGIEKNCSSILYNNLTFIPVRAVSETLGYDVSWDAFYLAVKITAPEVSVQENCKDYSYTYEDILYLGKITQVESGYQPFETKLGVAGTILNRVKSPLFPNSVKDVIFDTKYGVQFPPAHTGSFNVTPTNDTIVAAKCALNGVNVVGNSLYFIDVKHAASSWANRNRPYFGTINSMAFYE